MAVLRSRQNWYFLEPPLEARSAETPPVNSPSSLGFPVHVRKQDRAGSKEWRAEGPCRPPPDTLHSACRPPASHLPSDSSGEVSCTRWAALPSLPESAWCSFLPEAPRPCLS